MTAIVLLKPWKVWPIGHVIPEMPGNLARALIARGVGREQDEKKPAFTAPVDRNIRSTQMQLKRR